MPRAGSFWSESVLGVPNEASFRIVCSMLRASIWRTMLAMPGLSRGRRRVCAVTINELELRPRRIRLRTARLRVVPRLFICNFWLLSNAIGAALPNNDDLAVELLSDCTNRWLIGNERAELFRVASHVHGGGSGL